MKLASIAFSVAISSVIYAAETKLINLCGEDAILNGSQLIARQGTAIVGAKQVSESDFEGFLAEAKVGGSVLAHEADMAAGEKLMMVDPNDCSVQYTDIASMIGATAAGAGGGIGIGRVAGPTGAVMGGLAGAGGGLYAAIQNVQNAQAQCRLDAENAALRQRNLELERQNHCWKHGGSNCDQ